MNSFYGRSTKIIMTVVIAIVAGIFYVAFSTATDDSVQTDMGRYLMVWIESSELAIMRNRKEAQLTSEYGVDAPEVQDILRTFDQNIPNVFGKWGISVQEYSENREKVLGNQKEIEKYLADKPDLKKRYEAVLPGMRETMPLWAKQEIQVIEEFKNSHPDFRKRASDVRDKINKEGIKSRSEQKRFLEEHPDIKEEFERLQRELQEAIEQAGIKRPKSLTNDKPNNNISPKTKESQPDTQPISIGGMPEERFKQFYFLDLEMQEKLDIDYWIEQSRIKTKHAGDPEKQRTLLWELSNKLGLDTRKFLKERGTSWEEFHEIERLFTSENLDILFKRHPDVWERVKEVNRIKRSRLPEGFSN